MIARFDSLGDFAREAAQIPTGIWYCNTLESQWYGYLTHAKAVDLAINGDDSLVADALAIFDQLDAGVEVSTPTWTSDVCGAYPCVPEFLAGAPDCMRRRVPSCSDVSPVTVYVSTTCSASIKAEAMLKRGVAILALVLKLQSMRPVRICLLAETHGRTDGEYLQVIPLNTQPLDLATACYTLTNVGFARNLTYGLAHHRDDFNGAWPNGYGGGGAPWEAHVREVLDMQPQDLYIGAARDWDDAIHNPIAWVNAHIERFRTGEES